MSDDSEYARRLGEVLRRRDITALRAFLEEQAGRFGDMRQVEAIRAHSDADLALILHRMILARPDLRDLHAESARSLGEAVEPPSGRQPRSGRRRQPGAATPSADGPAPAARRRGARPPADKRPPDGRLT